MKEYRVNLGENGRIIIPAELRSKMQLNQGDEILLRYDNHSVIMMTMRRAVKEVQEIIMKHNKDNISLTDSFKHNG